MAETQDIEWIGSSKKEESTREVNAARGKKGIHVRPTIRTPIIDGHCHIFGPSLDQGEVVSKLSDLTKVTIVRRGDYKILYQFDKDTLIQPGIITKGDRKVELGHLVYLGGVVIFRRKPERVDIIREKSRIKFIHYEQYGPIFRNDTIGDDSTSIAGSVLGILPIGFARYAERAKTGDPGNAKTALEAIPIDFLGKQQGKAIVPLLLDLAYTPLSLMSETLVVQLNEPDIDYDRDGYYSGKMKYVWYNRDHFLWTILQLSSAASTFPGEVWPMLPYDPRRSVSGWTDEQGRSPLRLIDYAVKELGFVGVKLYSRCGWMPTDNHLMHGKEKGKLLDEKMNIFFDYVTRNDLPITCHASPTGFPPEGWLALPKKLLSPVLDKKTIRDFQRLARSSQKDRTWLNRDELTNNASPTDHIKLAWKVCNKIWAYCSYIQLAVSPYTWEIVLKKYNNLRLCFAHFGSEQSLLYHNEKLINVDKWIKENEDLKKYRIQNPMIAPGALFSSQGFEDACKQYAVNLIRGETISPGNLISGRAFGIVKSYNEYTIFDMISKIIHSENWQKHLNKWKEQYPDDWMTKMIELMEEYPNIYADISYLTGGDEEFFKDLFTSIKFDAEKRYSKKKKYNMIDKVIFGTDWYMPETDKIDANEYWKRTSDFIKNDPSLLKWNNKLFSTNILDFLNLKSRFDYLDSFYAQHAKKDIAKSWLEVKKYYSTKSC